MRINRPLFLILAFGTILILGLIPGCDELVTNETNTEVNRQDSLCINCHSSTGLTAADVYDQWIVSGHASGRLADTSLMTQDIRDCGAECHFSRPFIQSLGQDEAHFNGQPSEIRCYACHSIHTEWDYSLRTTTAITLVGGSPYNYGNSNLCAQCHHALVDKEDLIDDSTIIETNYINGWDTLMTHGMGEADMIIGEGGFEHSFDSVTWDWSSSHSHITSDSRQCINCHQEKVIDYDLGGHSLHIVSGSDVLTSACNISDCHVGTPAAVSAQTIASGQALIETRLSDLKSSLSKLGLVNLETGLPDTTILITDSNITGALYNYYYILNDKSRGMHDFVYDTLLLRASIDYLAGSLPPPKINVNTGE